MYFGRIFANYIDLESDPESFLSIKYFPIATSPKSSSLKKKFQHLWKLYPRHNSLLENSSAIEGQNVLNEKEFKKTIAQQIKYNFFIY